MGDHGHAIAGVFVFLLLGVFAVFSTMLVLVGAQAYRATTERTEDHSLDRTIYTYLLNTLRGDDAAGVVRIREENGIDMVAIAYDDYGGDLMEKRVYCYDGYLRESLTSTAFEFDPVMGEPICEAESLRAEMSGDLITIELTGSDGELRTVDAVLRTMR